MRRKVSPPEPRLSSRNAILDPAKAFAEAVRLHAGGDRAAAEDLCNAILVIDPRHAPSTHLLGIIAFQADQTDHAVALMQRSVEMDGANAQYVINLGNALMRAGRRDAACDRYQRALEIDPAHAGAAFNLANALAELARFDEAIAAYQRSLTIHPSAEACVNLGNLFHRLGRLDDAVASFNAALTLNPNLAEAHNSLGHVLQRLGRDRDALEALDRAVTLNPTYAEAHNNRGNALLALGAPLDAIESYRVALALRPGYVSALNNLGNALFAFGRYLEARPFYEQALALDPQSAAINNGLGNVLQKLGQWDAAIVHYERAIANQANFAEGWANLAAAYYGRQNYEHALRCCDTALSIEPNRFEALSNRGNTLVALDRFEDAIVSYQQALAVRPGAAEVLGNIGSALVELGQIDEAVRFFDQALAADPRRAKVHFLHVQAKRIVPNDPRLAAMEALARDIDSLSGDDQVDLQFALAKAYADIGRIDDAFPHLIAGNALKRRHVSYDEAFVLGHIDHIAGAFTSQVLRDWRGLGSMSDRPIFILGMPRSGSTLVEQILASLPSVVTGGELNCFPAAAVELLNASGKFSLAPIPAVARSLMLTALADRYLADLKAIDAEANRVTDKMPANFILAGLIHLAFPNAAIIHTRRNPLDTCLSCFSTLFAGGLPFSYDLGEIGRYYRSYDRLMRHWRAVLPEGAILDVDYETLVADFEAQARRIVAHCRLPWNDACLSFHATERRVKTASATQVRQPLYATAIARWRNIDPVLLKPLTDELIGLL